MIRGWVQSSDNAADIASRVTATPADLVEGSEWQNGPAYLWQDEESWPIRTDIMGGLQDLPQEELRKQYRHMAFHQTEKKQDEPKLVLDQIKERTNSWKVAIRKTRNLTRWLEITREKKLKLAYSRGWISRLMLEHELAELSNRLAVKCWLKHCKIWIHLSNILFEVYYSEHIIYCLTWGQYLE